MITVRSRVLGNYLFTRFLGLGAGTSLDDSSGAEIPLIQNKEVQGAHQIPMPIRSLRRAPSGQRLLV
jgi:hypothetical protein